MLPFLLLTLLVFHSITQEKRLVLLRAGLFSSLRVTLPFPNNFPMDFQNSHFANLTTIRDDETALYMALWHACAGPLVTVPSAGERVFYFPQGHLEQVEVCTNQVIEQLRRNHLPSNILCRVINVQLKAEADTDEVFAQVALLPETNQDENGTESMEPPLPPQPQFAVHSFCKTLNPSDTSIYGGFSVPKRHANDFFPPLDMSSQHPTQKLVARDLHGNEWRFEHVLKGQPRRHLLIRGWRDFVSSKRPVAGDSLVFLRGENGQLRVGLRRAMRRQGSNPFSTISTPAMFHQVLATAWEAYTRRTIFTVSYRPRTSPAKFIVPFDEYMESMRNNYSIGMRVQMKIETEAASEHRYIRFSGNIAGIEDADPVRWIDSKWRCLKVRWDQTETCSTPRPERVSPWNIEAAALAPTLP